MKKTIKLLAATVIIAVSAMALTSCGGGAGSTSDSKFFGEVPGIYQQMMEKKASIKEQYKNCSSESDAKKIMAEAEAAEKDYNAKLEEAAKALDGKTIEIESTQQFAVNGPITLTFDGFGSKSGMEPKFKLSGDVVATENYQSDDAKGLSGNGVSKYVGLSQHVNLIGLDVEGNEVFSQKVAYFPMDIMDADQLGVKAGTHLVFEDFTINKKNAEGVVNATTLRLAYPKE